MRSERERHLRWQETGTSRQQVVTTIRIIHLKMNTLVQINSIVIKRELFIINITFLVTEIIANNKHDPEKGI